MSDKDKSNLVLESKLQRPAYQAEGIEPKQAGKSLLHDEFGMPKVGKAQKSRIPVMKEISQEPVMVKAKPEKSKHNISDDDKFIPPRQNFVSVGNVDHSWYSDKVTGVVDNNNEVNVEALQGLNPLAEPTDSKTAEYLVSFRKRFDHIKSLVITELADIYNLEHLKNLRTNIFGKNGVFTNVVRQLGTLNIDKSVVGQLINQAYSEIDLEIQGKEFEITEEEKAAEEVTEWPEDIAAVTNSDEDETEDHEAPEEPEDDDVDSDENNQESADVIREGYYAIIVDGELINTFDDINKARELISNLLISQNVEFGRISLLKRLRLDFGIIVEE